MKIIFRFFSLLCFSFLILPAILAAQSSADISETEAINRIFDEIPVEERLKETPQNLYALLSQNPFGLQHSQNEQLLEQYENHFLSDAPLNHAREAFSNSYDTESIDAVLNWFQTEESQTVLGAQKEFYTLQGVRKRVVNQYELEKNPPADSRIQLINELSQAMSAVETEVESQVIIFRAAVSAFGELNNQQSLTPAQIEGAVNNFRYQIQSQVDREITNQLLTQYHGLEDEKLQKQVAFYKTDPGKWLSRTMSESIHSAYRTAADNFLDSVQDL